MIIKNYTAEEVKTIINNAYEIMEQYEFYPLNFDESGNLNARGIERVTGIEEYIADHLMYADKMGFDI